MDLRRYGALREYECGRLVGACLTDLFGRCRLCGILVPSRAGPGSATHEIEC